MKNEFIKKVLKGVGVSFASTLLTASVFFGQGMTAFAEEPEEIDVNALLSSVEISEEYSFEDDLQVSLEDCIDYKVDLALEEQVPSYNSSNFSGRNLTGKTRLFMTNIKSSLNR